jgi:FkbM family methyltransferase
MHVAHTPLPARPPACLSAFLLQHKRELGVESAAGSSSGGSGAGMEGTQAGSEEGGPVQLSRQLVLDVGERRRPGPATHIRRGQAVQGAHNQRPPSTPACLPKRKAHSQPPPRPHPHPMQPSPPRAVPPSGCNQGDLSLFAAAHGFLSVCMEVSPSRMPLLHATLALNPGWGHLVWVQQRALGAARDTLSLPNVTAGWDALERGGEEGGPMSVGVQQADDWLALGPVALMRLDMQGWEVDALDGAELTVPQLPALMMTLSPQRWER